MTGRALSRHETHDLGMIIKDRAKVLKAHVEHQAAVVMADFEKKLAAIYSFDQDDVWKAAWAEAEAVARDCQNRIAKRCEEMGIPRSFAPGISVDSNTRTNVGCFDQSGAANNVKVTILDNTGTQALGTTTLSLAPNGWGQTAVTTVVSGGTVQFDPGDSAVCYAVVVDNVTNDGRFISAAEYRP